MKAKRIALRKEQAKKATEESSPIAGSKSTTSATIKVKRQKSKEENAGKAASEPATKRRKVAPESKPKPKKSKISTRYFDEEKPKPVKSGGRNKPATQKGADDSQKAGRGKSKSKPRKGHGAVGEDLQIFD